MSRKKGIVGAVITLLQVFILAIIISLTHSGVQAKADSGIQVTGTVVNSNGVGVSGVSVYATEPGTSTVDFGPVTTDSAGTYDLTVAAGTYDFHFDPANDGSNLLPIVKSNVTVLADQTINIQFAPAIFTLSGTYTDENGNPIVGARIYLSDSPNEDTPYATTDSSGNYSLSVPEGVYPVEVQYLTGNDWVFTQQISGNVDLSSGNATQNYQVDLVPVTINTNDTDGNPVPNVVVVANGSGANNIVVGSTGPAASSFGFQGTTDGSGSLTLMAPQGTVFDPNQTYGNFPNNQRVDLANSVTVNGPTTVTLTGPVVPVYNTFSGTYTDENGNPIVGAKIYLSNSPNQSTPVATTDSSGDFSISAAAGVYPLEVQYNNGNDWTFTQYPGSVDLSSGNATQNYQVDLVPVTVNANDVDGNPIPNVRVILNGDSSDNIVVGSTGPADSSFGFDGTTDNSGSVSLMAPQGTVFEPGETYGNFPNNQTAYLANPVTVDGPTTLTLTGPAAPVYNTFSGTYTDENGNPIVGARIYLSDSPNQSTPVATTDSNGNFSLTAAAGVYPVEVQYLIGNDWVFDQDTGNVDLSSGNATQNYQVDLVPLTVNTNDVNGSPVPNVRIVLNGDTTANNITVGSTGPAASSFGSDGYTDNSGSTSVMVPQGTVFDPNQTYGNFPNNQRVYLGSPVTVNGPTTMTIALTPASITSTASASTGMNEPFTFQVTSTGNPIASLSESGSLPAGISFNNNGDGTATISGSAAGGTNGTYPITITAYNGYGVPSTQNFVLTVTTATANAAITSSNTDSEEFGVPFTFTVTTDGYPIPTIKKTGSLPTGVKFVDNGDGTATISGTPKGSASGTYTLTLTAKNAGGTATQTFTETIIKVPVFKSIPTRNLTAVVGTPYSLAVTTSAYDTASLSESGSLPAGMSLVDNGDGTATISGTPQVGDGDTYPITIIASNSYGSTYKPLTITVNEAPSITSANSNAATRGTPFNFSVTSAGFPAPKYSLLSGALPAGMHLDATTGVISGTPKTSDAAGTYLFTIQATNSQGFATQNFTLLLM
jgi:hypothetical protein